MTKSADSNAICLLYMRVHDCIYADITDNTRESHAEALEVDHTRYTNQQTKGQAARH